MLTIALAKGRLAEYACGLFEQYGANIDEIKRESRKLVFYDANTDMRFLMVKPSDVPVYVDHGIADIGVVGKDTLIEAALPLYEMLDLNYGRCRMAVAGYENGSKRLVTSNVTTVATKYPRIARRYFESKGQDIEIIQLHGSIELAPILGLSDVIVDIVESGATLRENGLSVLETVCEISAKLVVNQVSLKTKYDVIKPFINGIAAILEDRK